jgi:hypothetical protein
MLGYLRPTALVPAGGARPTAAGTAAAVPTCDHLAGALCKEDRDLAGSMLAPAFYTADQCIRVLDGAYSFKMIAAVYANIFINRHLYLIDTLLTRF